MLLLEWFYPEDEKYKSQWYHQAVLVAAGVVLPRIWEVQESVVSSGSVCCCWSGPTLKMRSTRVSGIIRQCLLQLEWAYPEDEKYKSQWYHQIVLAAAGVVLP